MINVEAVIGTVPVTAFCLFAKKNNYKKIRRCLLYSIVVFFCPFETKRCFCVFDERTLCEAKPPILLSLLSNLLSEKSRLLFREKIRLQKEKAAWGTLRKEGAPTLCISNKILLCLKRYSPGAMPFFVLVSGIA